MIYLIASIISSVMIAVVIRINEGIGLNRSGVMLFNYIAATALSLALVDIELLTSHFQQLAPLSCVSSCFFVSAFIVYMKAVNRLGLAIPVTATRLSVVIPALGSVFIFSEKLNFFQWTGLLLAVIAIYLFSWNNAERSSGVKRSGLLLTPLLFLLMGSGDFSLKVFQEMFKPELMMSFIFMVFGISIIYTLLLVILQRIKIDSKVVLAGFLLGIPNFAAAYFILRVLQVLPGSTAFPLNNIGIILLSTFVGYLFWKERLRKRTGIAILIAIAAVVLLNVYNG
jgi:drug/metabolite transporter (DMT)-like permease